MIRTQMDRQRDQEEGMTRKEIMALMKQIHDALDGTKTDRVAEILRDQFEAIIELERIRTKDAMTLLMGPWMLNALARQHHYSTAREALQGFYNWLRNEENEAQLMRYRHQKY